MSVEKAGSFADPRIVCRSCPPGTTLGLVWQFAGTIDIPPWYSTPEALRQELERAESPKGIKVQPISDPEAITLDSFRGWAVSFEYNAKGQPGHKMIHGYLSDGCATVVLLADTNPLLLGGSALSRLPADEVIRQLGDMLQSATVVRVDP